jgi:hypothetical protein
MAVEISKFDIHPSVLGTLCYTTRGKKTRVTGDVCYNKISKSEIQHQEREKSIEKWQQQWDNTTKG